MSNADKIQTWRDANPDRRITGKVLLDILGVDSLQNADLQGANLMRANLTGAILTNAFLSCADLRGVDLLDATLTGANLRDAYLTGADLRRAYLTDADLTGADLKEANLWGTNLTDATLTDADLRGANLTRANLMRANLTGAFGGVIQIENVYPYPATLQPTPDGWYARVGCWYGTLEDLHKIATGDDWPEARGEERERRRPLLQAILTVFDAHVTNRPDIINRLDNQWRD